jgi:hypothetical protein
VIERWNALSLRAKRWWTVAGVVLALFVLMSSLNALGRAPGGPALSANSTGGDGLAAWSELLDVNAHATAQLRADLARAPLDPQTTVIAIGQVFTRKEIAALRRFVDSGGILVIGDLEAQATLRAFGDRAVRWEPVGGASLAITGTSLSVRGDGFGSWNRSSGAPLTGGATHAGAVQVSYGRGSVVALADPSPVTNAWLDRADNAWFAVRIAGGDGRRVMFSEHGHGYGTSSGFAALPARWKTALWFAAFAAVIGAWAAGKRLGPADVATDTPPPERVRYIYAVASTLARTRDREGAADPLRARGRELLARRSGRRDLADEVSVRAAARAVGLDAADADALVAPLDDDQALVALARSVAHLEEI